jgi:protein TonB
MKKKINILFKVLRMLMFLSLLTSGIYIFAKPQYMESSVIKNNSADLIKDNLPANAKPQNKNINDPDGAFSDPYQMPEFPGGQKKLMEFIKTNLKYPEIAREKGVWGTVIVQFVVDKKGKIGGIRVMRGIGSGCDEEAVRIIQSMPNLIPGRNYGELTDCTLTLPVRFVKPLGKDELRQLTEQDKKIDLYTPDQIMRIIKDRENISDSIKILSFKEYRESESKDYQFYYTFIDYTPQNKYIRRILNGKTEINHVNRSGYITPEWYPLTFYKGELYSFESRSRSPYTFTDSVIYSRSNHNNPYVINESKIMDEDLLKFYVSRYDRKEFIDVYFINRTHKQAFFNFRKGQPQLYADSSEINSFPIIVCVASQGKDYYNETEKIESENLKLPCLRGRVNELLNHSLFH